MKSQCQQRIDKYFPNRPIAYQPGLAIVFKSVPVGIFLSQMLYWQGKGVNNDGWIYKTIEELRSETGLTRSMQDLAIDKLIELGIIECRLAGIPAKRHFKLNFEKLENLLPSLKEKANVKYLNPPPKFAGNQQSNTYSTHETTTKNTHRNYKNNQKTSSLADLANQRYERLARKRKSNDFGYEARGHNG